MAVDRCVCNSVSFEALRQLATSEQLNLRGLMARTNCCTGCGACAPYVRLMLQTGRTSFPVISNWEFERLLGKGCLTPPEAGTKPVATGT